MRRPSLVLMDAAGAVTREIASPAQSPDRFQMHGFVHCMVLTTFVFVTHTH